MRTVVAEARRKDIGTVILITRRNITDQASTRSTRQVGVFFFSSFNMMRSWMKQEAARAVRKRRTRLGTWTVDVCYVVSSADRTLAPKSRNGLLGSTDPCVVKFSKLTLNRAYLAFYSIIKSTLLNEAISVFYTSYVQVLLIV
jgi:hypothetical protein